mmetsp:Transcript_22522/g.90292  ORF Transcript_22522/g.90292 Transcript_22522/m.90292 type:complete len:204 (+) Transcript_22522:1061-1672(+)
MPAVGISPHWIAPGFSLKALVIPANIPRIVPRIVCGRVNFRTELTRLPRLLCSLAAAPSPETVIRTRVLFQVRVLAEHFFDVAMGRAPGAGGTKPLKDIWPGRSLSEKKNHSSIPDLFAAISSHGTRPIPNQTNAAVARELRLDDGQNLPGPIRHKCDLCNSLNFPLPFYRGPELSRKLDKFPASRHLSNGSYSISGGSRWTH